MRIEDIIKEKTTVSNIARSNLSSNKTISRKDKKQICFKQPDGTEECFDRNSKEAKAFKEALVNEMAVMQRQDVGFGLSQFVGDEYALVGGFRSGSSPAGVARLQYDIFDIEIVQQDQQKAKVGKVELFVEDGTNEIKGLVNIELNSKGKGIGRKIVQDIVDTAGGELEIFDIQKQAVGFWERMGIEFENATKRKGVIRS